MAKFKVGSTMAGRIIATEKYVDNKIEPHINDKNNPHEVTKSQIGLGDIENYPLPSQAIAENGVNAARYMTPLRTRQGFENFLTPYEEKVSAIEETRKNVVSDTSGLDREVAYLKLMQDTKDRIEGGILFADDFKGSRFGMTLTESENVLIQNGKALLKKGEQGLILLNDVPVGTTEIFENTYADNIVKMDNGWLVIGLYFPNSAIAEKTKFYVSKDDGENWTFLAHTGEEIFDMDTYNNDIYVLYKANDRQIRFRRFNPATTPAGGEAHLSTGYISSFPLGGQQWISSGSIAVSPDGTVYVAVSSTRSDGQNSYNITLLTSTNNGTGWSGYSEITSDNSPSIQNLSVRVIASSSSKPTIYYGKTVNGSNTLNSVYVESGTYGYNQILNVGGVIVAEIDVYFDSASKQHICFRGGGNIYYARLLSDGKTLAKMINLGSGNTPAITVNADNHIIVSYLRQGGVNYRKSTDGGESFGAETSIGSASYIKSVKGKNIIGSLPQLFKVSSGSPVYYGQKEGASYEDFTEGSLTYEISDASFIGLFLLLKGSMNATATINGQSIELTSANVDELKGVLKLEEEQTITLKINLSRPNITGGDNDYLGRLLGGRN